MKETLIPALILAAISGLTWVAYKHPKGYEKIMFALYVFIGLPVGWFIGTVFELIFCLSALRGATQGAEETPTPLGPLVSIPLDIIQDVYVPFSKLGWILFITVAVYAYLTFLFYLPKILGLKEDEGSKQISEISDTEVDN